MDAQQIRQKLEDSGLRCTAQRYSVMSFLMGHHEHPTAAEIFEAVNRLDPRSSRATTYNNLRDLVEAGLVSTITSSATVAAASKTSTGTPSPPPPHALSANASCASANSSSAASAPPAPHENVQPNFQT